jgi:hypothetical protein
MPLTPERAPLAPDVQKAIDVARPLSSYKLNFTNGDYPALSFVYAIFAGGEHALYCDHSEDFFKAYLVDAVVEKARKKADADVDAVRTNQGDVAAAHAKADADVAEARAAANDRAQSIVQIFNRLYAWQGEAIKLPVEKQDAVLPREAEIDAILAVIRAELLRTGPDLPPVPAW